MSTSNLNQYRTVGAHGTLAEATPHQVVKVMLDAVLSRISEASGHIERGEVQAKGEKIGKALGIIEALMLGLDKERGGELALNLERLYDYSSRTLLKAQSREPYRSLEGSQRAAARDQDRLGRHRALEDLSW